VRPDAVHRAGAVALLGPPNAGKSTLLNAILGQKLAIVSAKPQMTRSRILGICTRPAAQILLLDTPGLHQGRRPLNAALNEAVAEAIGDCDLGLVLVDLERGWQPEHGLLCDLLRAKGKPFFLVGTKADVSDARQLAWPPAAARSLGAPDLRVSARSGEGLEPLLAAVERALPESPRLYPEDELTDRPLRWLAGELVREAASEELEQELPYVLAVQVLEFEESRPDLTRIRAQLLVARESQKRIVVGAGGAMVKRIGVRARLEIERLLERRVHLDLRVKVDPRWHRSAERIKRLGYG
jgi:GTP-binding protein Era